MIKLVDPLLIFDAGNVLLRHDDRFWLQELSAACRDPATAMPILDLRIIEATTTVGTITVRQFFESIREEVGFIGDYDAFDKLWCCHFSHIPEMEDLLPRLVTRYRLVVLSNTDDSHWAYLKPRYPILSIPHVLYTSFELHLAKPDPAIYQAVLKAENRKADDTIFIDDRQDNVDAANALGIHAILFTGRAALEVKLAEYGVTI